MFAHWPRHRRTAAPACILLCIGIFEMLFVNISSNAVNGAFNRVSHPFGGPKSLGIEVTIFDTDSESTVITIVCIFGLLTWCIGFLGWIWYLGGAFQIPCDVIVCRVFPKISKLKFSKVGQSTNNYSRKRGFFIENFVLLFQLSKKTPPRYTLMVNGPKMSKSPFISSVMLAFLARFTDENYWWSLCLLGRRFLIGMVPSLSLFGIEDNRVRVYVLICILFIAIILNIWRRPYRYAVHDFLDNATLFCMCFLLPGVAFPVKMLNFVSQNELNQGF